MFFSVPWTALANGEKTSVSKFNANQTVVFMKWHCWYCCISSLNGVSWCKLECSDTRGLPLGDWIGCHRTICFCSFCFVFTNHYKHTHLKASPVSGVHAKAASACGQHMPIHSWSRHSLNQQMNQTSTFVALSCASSTAKVPFCPFPYSLELPYPLLCTVRIGHEQDLKFMEIATVAVLMLPFAFAMPSFCGSGYQNIGQPAASLRFSSLHVYSHCCVRNPPLN